MKKMKCPKWLKEMPKAELHCHIGGSMRLDTILELASDYGVDIGASDRRELRKKVVFKNRPEKSLPAYLEGIALCESVLVRPEAFQRVAFEICQDAYNEGSNIIELRFGPTNYQSDNLSLYEIVEATLDGINRASTDLGMYAGLIICGIRTDMDATRKAAELASNYQDKGVVGFDLAGKEKGHRPKLFEGVIKPVIDNFVPVTIHAGEDDTVASIAEALNYLNAKRIGHGVALRESTKLFRYINIFRIGLEMCPTSNIDTGSVSCYDTHPIRGYYHDGLRVTVNTDNRTISDTTITKEYLHLMEHLGFEQHDIYKLARNAIKASFLDDTTTKKLLSDFESYTKSPQGRRSS